VPYEMFRSRRGELEWQSAFQHLRLAERKKNSIQRRLRIKNTFWVRLLFKIHADSPEARDEGPRLLPNQEHKGESHTISSRILELADASPKRKLRIDGVFLLNALEKTSRRSRAYVHHV
jgi:hypothetical protein